MQDVEQISIKLSAILFPQPAACCAGSPCPKAAPLVLRQSSSWQYSWLSTAAQQAALGCTFTTALVP